MDPRGHGPYASAHCFRVQHRMFSGVTLAKDIFINIKQSADVEYSEIYKMTEEKTNMAGTVVLIPRHCGRQTMRNNVKTNTPEIYW